MGAKLREQKFNLRLELTSFFVVSLSMYQVSYLYLVLMGTSGTTLRTDAPMLKKSPMTMTPVLQ